MNINDLLQEKHCGCGMVHSCAIRHVRIGKNALESIPELTAGYGHVLLAADSNTYALCGDRVAALLGEKLADTLVYRRSGLLVPNEEAIAELEARLTADTDLIVGIGSGVIQDLCKYVSFQAKLPYHIIATAPSMDGYASKGAAMIIGSMKVTYNAHVPEAIVGDLDILKTAPMEMIQAGYGDILGKYSCLNDWKLSRVVNGEYFCQEVHDLSYHMLLKTRDLGPALLNRDPEAIGTLMEALVGVGIAMAYAGNSRPASGSEHHLSHFFEITGILDDVPYFSHGIDVIYSAVATAAVRQQVLASKPHPYSHDQAAWDAEIEKIYSTSAEAVKKQLAKLNWYNTASYENVEAKWEQIKEVLAEAPDEKRMLEMVESVGLDYAEFVKLYGQEKIDTAVLYAKDLKDRYSVLWLNYMFCR